MGAKLRKIRHFHPDFRKDALREALGLPLEPLAVLAIGKPAESIIFCRRKKGDRLAYYRKSGVHFVPKLQLEDLLV